MSDFMAFISAITFIALALLIFFAGGYFSYYVIRKLFWNDETIIIMPSFYSFTFGFFFFIDTLFLTVMIICQLVYSPYKINVANVRRLLPFLIIIVVICFCGTFLSFTIFENDKIIFRNISHVLGKKYSYNDIIKVEVFIKKYSKIGDRLKYLIIMKDGRKIDLNVLQLQGGEISSKNHGISFKKILYVESLINKDIPHVISKEAYNKLENAFFYLTPDFHKKFRRHKNFN